MIDNRRFCTVNGDKAYFHRWIEETDVFLRVNTVLSQQSHLRRMADQMKAQHIAPHDCDVFPTRKTWALIEYINGEIVKVDPESVRFTDN